MSDFPEDPTADLPYAFGGPPLRGVLRASPEDFQVDEQLGYSAGGEGEHAFLQVRKRELNTADVARELARFAGVRQVNVGFAGMKDKYAVTTQYFSVHLPGQPDPDWQALGHPQIKILSAQRHNRKIRRGSLRGNCFVLVLRELQGERAAAEQVLERIKVDGVPNYFGPQRFGRGASNLQRAEALFAGELRRVKPEQRRMLLSAARSYLFNQVLAERVRQGNWQQGLAGEVMLLNGSNRQFLAEQIDAEITQRLAEHDIHPSGPLPGDRGRCLQPLGEALQLEQAALNDALALRWLDGLARAREDSERRALRLLADELQWQWLAEDVLELRFGLPSGAFATTLVRELMRDADEA